jgi:hypothetical protein
MQLYFTKSCIIWSKWVVYFYFLPFLQTLGNVADPRYQTTFNLIDGRGDMNNWMETREYI